MKFHRTLRFKLLLFSFLILLIPSIIIAVIAPYYYYKVISDRTSVLNQSLISSVKQNFETYLDQMERLTLIPYYSTDAIYALSLRDRNEYASASAYNKLVADRAIYNLMNKYVQDTNQYIIGSILVSTDGSSFIYSSYGSSNLKPDFIGNETDWYKEAMEADGKTAYIGAHKQDYLKQDSGETVFSVARVIKDTVTQRKIAVVMVDARLDVLKDIVNNAGFDVNSTIALFDDQNRVVFSSQALSDDVKSQILANKSTVKLDTGYYKIISSTALKSNWKMYVMFSLSDINEKLKVMYITGIIFAVCGFFLTFIVFLFFTNRITNPFRKMIRVMDEAKKGNLSVRFNARGNDEIALLGEEFNNMLIRIDDLVNREYKANLAMKEARFFALQAQIKPHFLFNTLNGFIGLNRLADRDALEKSILSLTRMMRYVLEPKSTALIGDEFNFLSDYCSLQKLRFDDRLNYSIECCRELLNYTIPKLILQPIVENAIIHGIEPAGKECFLQIICTQVNRDGKPVIHFEINDDGIGFDTSEQVKLNSKGLKNVRDRLDLQEGFSSFSVKSNPGEGTKVIIELQKGNSDENLNCR